MKCPKCGYNSFSHLDSCKKCSTNLVEFKKKHGLYSAAPAVAASVSLAVQVPPEAPSWTGRADDNLSPPPSPATVSTADPGSSGPGTDVMLTAPPAVSENWHSADDMGEEWLSDAGEACTMACDTGTTVEDLECAGLADTAAEQTEDWKSLSGQDDFLMDMTGLADAEPWLTAASPVVMEDLPVTEQTPATPTDQSDEPFDFEEEFQLLFGNDPTADTR